MSFDNKEEAVKHIYMWAKGKIHNVFYTKVIDLYMEASAGERIRLSKGFPLLPEMLAIYHTQGDQLFIDYGLMKEPNVTEGDKLNGIRALYLSLTTVSKLRQDTAVMVVSEQFNLTVESARCKLGYLGLLK